MSDGQEDSKIYFNMILQYRKIVIEHVSDFCLDQEATLYHISHTCKTLEKDLSTLCPLLVTKFCCSDFPESSKL